VLPTLAPPIATADHFAAALTGLISARPRASWIEAATADLANVETVLGQCSQPAGGARKPITAWSNVLDLARKRVRLVALLTWLARPESKALRLPALDDATIEDEARRIVADVAIAHWGDKAYEGASHALDSACRRLTDQVALLDDQVRSATQLPPADALARAAGRIADRQPLADRLAILPPAIVAMRDHLRENVAEAFETFGGSTLVGTALADLRAASHQTPELSALESDTADLRRQLGNLSDGSLVADGLRAELAAIGGRAADLKSRTEDAIRIDARRLVDAAASGNLTTLRQIHDDLAGLANVPSVAVLREALAVAPGNAVRLIAAELADALLYLTP
jgi:hypothetical protein